MSIPETRAQQRVHEAIISLVAKEGRGVTLAEISAATGLCVSTCWKHVQRLATRGILQRGIRGIQPTAEGQDRYSQGWIAACTHIRGEAGRVLQEQHASPATTRAVMTVLDCAEEGVKP